MMRIVLVSQEYPPETAHGGIATQTWVKAHGLAARGHEIVVVSHSVDGTRRVHRDGAIEVIRIPGFDDHLPLQTDVARWLSYSLLVAAELASLQRRFDVDVIDFPEWGCEGYMYLLNRDGSDHTAVVLHLHGPLIMLANTIGWPEADSELYRVGQAMEATCLRLADAIVSSSRCSAQWASQHPGIGVDESMPVIHAGIDTQHFRPALAARDPAPTIVFVGRVASSKGIDTLVEAASTVAEDIPGLQLRLIGSVDDAMRSELERRCTAADHPALLQFAGFVSREALPRELCRAHVFAAPSRYEGGPGFVYLEAMACGLPVVACSGSGSAEVIQDGQTGLLVAPGDAPALAEALRGLLIDPSRSDRLGQAARRYTVAEADSRICMARFEQFLTTVAGARR